MLLGVKVNTISKTQEADQPGGIEDLVEVAVSGGIRTVTCLGPTKVKIEVVLAPIRVEVDFSQIKIRTGAGLLRIKVEVDFSQIKIRTEADLLRIRDGTIKTPTKIEKGSTRIKTVEDFILTAEEVVAADIMGDTNGQT